MRDALVIHAVATPFIFAIVSSVYFALFGSIRPATTAAIFVIIVVSLDALVIAPLIEKSFDMFHSFLGTWLPFALIFLTTWLTGTLTARWP